MKELRRNLVNTRKDKHHKLSQRFIKLLKSGSFSRLSRRKQYQVVERIKKLERQLKEYHISETSSCNLNFKHWAIALALGVVSYAASGQEVKKSKTQKSPFYTEKKIERLKDRQGYQPLNSSARTNAFTFDLIHSLGNPPSQAAVTGDFDGDGDIDVVYGSYASNYILRNNGSFNIQQEELSITSKIGEPVNKTGIDFDGDGDPDILMNKNHDYLELWQNDGTGNFNSGGIVFNPSLYIHKTEIFDLDSDMDVDMLYKDFSDTLRLATNDGTGSFTSSSVLSDIIALYDVGDIDGDGDTDVFVNESYYYEGPYGGYHKQRETFLLNDGTGQLTSSGNSLGEYFNYPELLDVDNDGDLDIINSNSIFDPYSEGATNYIEVFKNDGLGNFPTTPSTQITIPDYSFSYSRRYGDIDADGDMDIMEESYSMEGTDVLINDGTGIFTNSKIAIPYAEPIADLDGDGDVDIASFSYVYADVWRNDENLNFEKAAENILELSSTVSLGLLDLNSDGQKEILQFGASKVWNNARTEFNVSQRLNEINFDHDLADVDRDGDMDIVAATYNDFGNHIASVWSNDGGTLVRSDSIGFAVDGSAEGDKITSGDIDGDADDDFIVMFSYWDSLYYNDFQVVSTWKNNSTGQFSYSDTTHVKGYYEDIQLMDVDNDGDLDLIALDEKGIVVGDNDGTGAFTFGNVNEAANPNNYFTFFEVQDFDSDGDFDAFVTNSNSEGGHNYLFRNDGFGVFSYDTVNTAKEAFPVAAGDMDNDGDTDIVMSGYSVGNNTYYSEKIILLNDGAGNFTDSGLSVQAEGFSNYAINLGDLDSDGDLDIISGGTYFPVEVWQNNMFAATTQLEQDSSALVSFFNANGGENWIDNTNWLQGNVDTWFGVTITNDRVTNLVLPANNVTGALNDAVTGLGALTELDLSDNELTAIPDLSPLAALTTADVSGNNLQFGSLEASADVEVLTYAPQDSIGEVEEFMQPVHTSLVLSEIVSGTANAYQWYKDGLLLSGETNDSLVINDLTIDNMGSYYLEVTNERLMDLTLYSRVDDVFATASISGALFDEDANAVADADVVLLQVTSTGGFDTTAIVAPDNSGAYMFNDVVLDNYQILADPDTLVNPDFLPSYYISSIFWEEADTLSVVDVVTNVDITIQGFAEPALEGSGELWGTIFENVPDGRITARKRIKGAGVSIRRKRRSGKKGPGNSKMLEDYELIGYMKSDETGEFTFPKLPEDTYRLNIQYPGYPMDTTSYVDITIGSGRKSAENKRVEAEIMEGKIVVKDVTVVSIDENPGARNVHIYPNPSNEYLYINFVGLKVEQLTMKIYNSNGQLVKTDEISTADQAQINISSLKKGIYILKLYENDRKVNTHKLIVE